MIVFTSYSSHDATAMQSLMEHLRLAREQVWFDQNLGSGEAWWSDILERIRDSDVFIFALSDNAVNSTSCQSELAYAKVLGIPILPIQVADVSSDSVDPLFMTPIMDYRQPTVGTAIKLMNALHAYAGQRKPLPDPLPPPPAVPDEFLRRVEQLVSGQTPLSVGEQAFVLKELRKARLDQDESIRPEIGGLLRALRRRPELNPRTVSEIDAILGAPTGHKTPSPEAASEPDSLPPPGRDDAAWGIFISYRRSDEKSFAGRLYERLLRDFDPQQIFMDVDAIDLGLDFREVIERRLAQCSVMLVVIGPEWLNSADLEGNRRRLDDPNDWVRLEIEAALRRPGVPVIPILVDGASIPKPDNLPESLRDLASRQSINMSHEDFGSDAARLLRALDGALRH